MTENNEASVLAEISTKLDMIFAALVARDLEEDAAIERLKSLGCTWPQIGAIVGMAPNTAAKRYQRMTKPKKGSKSGDAK